MASLLKIEGFQGKFRPEGKQAGGNPQRASAGASAQGAAPGSATKPVPARPRPGSSFKIKDTLREVSQAHPEPKVRLVAEPEPSLRTDAPRRTEAREPLDETKVGAAFERYLRDNRVDPSVAIALRTHRPEVEGEQICLAVDNQLQLEKIEALKPHLRRALAETLGNGHIGLSFKLFDRESSAEEKRYFTAGEKFGHFLEINPVVGDLKNIFALELE